MKIGPDTVVTFDYLLSLPSGEVVDSTEGRRPIEFLYGREEILPGLEKGLAGMEEGETRELIVQPEEGFGLSNPQFIHTIPRGELREVSLTPGMEVELSDARGRSVRATLREVREEFLVIDLNHPFAGQPLYFKVTVRAVRPSSPKDYLKR
ncbi:MAG: peptidylprolyl isomerase [Candidatus Tectomicrobia bacterium]|nr:peptidylprolyl isomerase [Candidatus Tectomicrobia bacterium]